jgi:hypothetical protein
MVEQTKVKLSRLREIGWSQWDPIGLSQLGNDYWKDGGPCADEYDSYLLQVVERLRRGEPRPAIVAYLEDIEVDYMGLGPGGSTRARADRTVAAIAEYLSSLPAGPLKVG